ncbi:polysaccharide deacetylase family protein [Frankia sp. Mgl5]|uniref:polysaccharide deacetylase family protein n=1 Tax=Frankia sp. Mgl5 TaxID=2933793 RepID=UPI00200E9EC5|nr:polysaccharide deacetylase family protein [Frankia sp. Mgl5]
MSLSRRVLLAIPLLAGCAGQPGTANPASSSDVPPSPTPSLTEADHSMAIASSASSPAPTAGTVTRNEVIARYGHIRPSTWGLDVPGVTTMLPTSDRVIALTFDACGGPHGSGYDQELISFLRRHEVPATLFLNSRWLDANPQVFRDLAADPLFEIANHGTRHRPLSVSGQSAYGITGTHDVGEVFDEIDGNRGRLSAFLGHPPRFFRSGTAHCDDVAARIAADLGEHIVNFDVNADAGATFTPDQVARAVLTARPGSIVIGHMNHPSGGTARGDRQRDTPAGGLRLPLRPPIRIHRLRRNLSRVGDPCHQPNPPEPALRVSRACASSGSAG